jgi:nucleoside-diphosphate-sugar epimerase
MTLEGKRVLVTGGTGAIGGRLVEKLILEHRAHVRVLVRSFRHASRIARFPLEMAGGDLTDKEAVCNAVRGCEVVFHTAYDFAGDQERQKKTALDGTRHVCEAVLKNGVARLVYTSSFAVYGWSRNGELTETSPWQAGGSLYQRVKRDAERLILKLYRDRQVPAVIVQPTLVYGPFAAWTMAPVNELKTGLVPLLDNGSGYCNAVYVDDVADALIQAATQPGIIGQTFLISATNPVTWQEFYAAYETMLGVHATVSMSEGEVRKAMQEKKRQSGTVTQMIDLAREPKVSAKLVSLPVVQTGLRAARRCLGFNQWDSLKSSLRGESSLGGSTDGSPGRPLCVPNESFLALYRSKVNVRIDKARSLLGYEPKFDLHRGMRLTSEFVRWANLA